MVHEYVRLSMVPIAKIGEKEQVGIAVAGGARGP